MNQQAGSKGKLDHDAADSPASKLVGGAIQKTQSKTMKLTPIHYISQDDPPFLIMHGDQDFLVPLQQSLLLHEALQKAGSDSTLRVLKGKGHGGFDANQVRPEIIGFFKKHLMSNRPNCP